VSDKLRIALIKSAAQLAVTNPILGVSPQDVPHRLGDLTQSEFGLQVIDSHNVFGHLGSGSGLLCLILFVATGILLCTWNPYRQQLKYTPTGFRDARALMQALMFLYLVRGMFTREILYNPGFAVGIGLVLGLMIVCSGEPIAGESAESEYEEAYYYEDDVAYA
jgi:hypothetical protein